MLTPQAPVRVLDTDLTQLSEIDTYQNFYYEKGLNTPGQFELKINWNQVDGGGFRYADYFQRGRFILVGGDVSKIGIIQEVSKEIGIDGKGSQWVTVKGREATAILQRRIVEPPAGSANYTQTAVAETVMKAVVTAQMGSGAVANRQISIVNVVASAGLGASYTYSSRYKNLGEDLQTISLATGIGYRMTLNNSTNKLDFDCYAGVNRVASQYVNPRMIISTDFDTLKTGKIISSEVIYKNIVYGAGQGVGDSRNIRKIYDTTEPTGIERREVFTDMRELSTNADIDAKGGAVLKENQTTTFVDASALVYSQYVYGVDYNVGDYITLEAYGQSVDVQITSVKESWSNGNYDISMTFNRQYPTFPAQVRSNSQNIGMSLANTEVSAWKPYPAGTYVFPSGNQTVAEGVLAVGAVTTAPTPGAGATMKAYYRDNGNKSIDIMIIAQNNGAAGTAGSGRYLVPLPLGKTIDTNIVAIGASNNDYGQCLGCAHMSTTGSTAAFWVAPVSSTLLQFGGTYFSNSANYWGAAYPFNTTNMSASTTCIGIPIV